MRRELEHRPLLLAAIGLALGIACMVQPMWLVAALIPGVVCRPLACRAILLVSLGLGLLLAPRPPSVPSFTTGLIRGQIEVASMPEVLRGGSKCEVSSNGAKYLMESDGQPRLSIGDVAELSGEVRPIDPKHNEFMARRNIIGVIRAKAVDIHLVSEGPAIYRSAMEWRDSFVALCNRTLDERTSSLVQALCFNVRGGLSGQDMSNLKRTGIVHIVSTSGLHVFILAFSLQFGLGLVPVSRSIQLGVLYAVLALYACATGLDPPIVRSVLMAIAVLSAPWFEREGDFPSALGLAAAAFLFWRPAEVFELGFQLSFVAVLALWMFAQYTKPAQRGLRSQVVAQAKSSLRASSVATAATAPLLAQAFGMFSIVAVLANLMVAGVIGPLIVCALLAWAAAPISEALSAGLMHVVVQPLTQWILAVTDVLGSWSWSAVTVPPLPAALWTVLYLGAILIWRPIARPA